MTAPALDVLTDGIGRIVDATPQSDEIDELERTMRARLADLDALVQAAQAMLDWERDPLTGEPPDGEGKALAAALARVTAEAR